MKNLTIVLSLFIVLFNACKKDDDGGNSSAGCSNSSITINWNGTSVPNEDGFNNTLFEQQFGEQMARRLDLRTNVDGGTFILSVSNMEWQNPPSDGVLEKIYYTNPFDPRSACKDINGNEYCDEGLASYIKGAEQYYSDEVNGTITITSCDNVNKVVSGTYDVTIIEFFEEDTITVSGAFTDLCYRNL